MWTFGRGYVKMNTVPLTGRDAGRASVHIHLGPVEVVRVFAIVLLAGTLWRIVAGWLRETAIGQAMAFMY